ncbi:MAG: pyridoxamine 5'-phosphate oxidase family protein [Actinomycetota bacterium]
MSDELSWDELAADLNGIASMATVTPDGEPHVSVISSAVVDGTVWIGTSRGARKAINVGGTPSVALVWSGSAEVYLWGSAELVDDVDTKRSFWDDGVWSYDPAMFFQTPDNPDYVLIRVTPERAMSMSFGEQGPTQRRWRAGG